MQSTTDKLAGNRWRWVADFGLTVATFLALAAMFVYYKSGDALMAIFAPASQDRA